MVILDADGESSRFLGSCSAFRVPHFALTAAHVVKGYPTDQLSLRFPGQSVVRRVHNVIFHEYGDIAILETQPLDIDVRQGLFPDVAFLDVATPSVLGEDVLAVGYPQETPVGASESETPLRLFKGHIQRVFANRDLYGHRYRYDAAELSMPAPRGASGGPVFTRDDPNRLVGVIAGNYESHRDSYSFEEEQGPGKIVRTKGYNIINYGIAILGAPLLTWFDEHIPRWSGVKFVNLEDEVRGLSDHLVGHPSRT